MLYSPQWEYRTKADPSAVRADLIAWLEKQPAAREYDYTNPSECLIAQYLKHTGAENYLLSSDEVAALLGDPDNDVVEEFPHTFGAALQRARASVGGE